MASVLSEDDVRRIADLARLDLTEAEVRRFAAQLTAIVGYAATIQEADTSQVTAVVPATPRPAREDITRPGLERDSALAGAPDAGEQHGLFRVPRVL